MREYEEIVELVADFLNKNDIPYVIVGAVSVAVWGEPRTSRDIDLMIVLGDKIERFVRFLNNNNFSVSIEDIKTALKEKSHFTVFDNLSLYFLDVKGLYTNFDINTFNRRKKVKFKNKTMWVCSPEDLILCKLEFGSEQDLNDAKSVLIRQGNKLDKGYLDKRVKELKLEKVYSKTLKEFKKFKR